MLQFKNLPQRDHEVESVLDTEILDMSGTPKTISRDELGSGDQKKKFHSNEINISTVDYQVSTEPTLGSSVLADTLPADEKQLEAEPSRHYKRFRNPS
jgi:hypothetical protein